MTSPIDTERDPPAGQRAKMPGLPSPRGGATDDFLAKIKEIIETREGVRGSKYEKTVTFWDLYELGLIAVGGNRALQGGNVTGTGMAPDIAGSNGQTLITRLEGDLRASKLFKDLMTRIDDVANNADFPEEIRAILNQSLAAEAAQRRAAITHLENTIQDAERSLAYQVNTITAAVDGAAAGVREVTFASAQRDKVMASKITQVSARLDNAGGAGVTVEQKFTAQADAITGLSGQYSVKINAGGKIAGFGLSNTSPTAGVGTSSFIILADKFGIFTGAGDVMPFGVDASGVYINGTLRVNASALTLSALAANAAVPAISFIGTFSTEPSPAGYSRNNVYRNLTNGNSYVLNAVGAWELYNESGIGPAGPRGTVNIAEAGHTVWSDSGAAAAIASAGFETPRNGDMVTLYGTGFSQTRFYSGSSWLTIAAYINGNMLVDGTVSATQIDSRGLSIKDASGNVILSAGTALDYAARVTNKPTTLSAINSSEGSKLSGVEAGATYGASFGVNIGGQINSGNVSTYIANAAISSAYIANLTADKVNSGTLSSISINIGSGAFTVSTSGVVQANNLFSGVISGANNTAPSSPTITGNSVGSAEGVFAVAQSSASTSHGLRGRNNYYNTSGLVGMAGAFDFYAEGSGTNYGPFTGAHDALMPNDITPVLGDIVIDVYCLGRRGYSNTIFEVEHSSESNQRGVLGVVSAISGTLDEHPPAVFLEATTYFTNDDGHQNSMQIYGGVYYQIKDLYNVIAVNALGEGLINVCGEGGDIAKGDLIVASSMAGKGMKQADDIVRGYTVAKAREVMTFSSLSEVKTIACIYLCG